MRPRPYCRLFVVLVALAAVGCERNAPPAPAGAEARPSSPDKSSAGAGEGAELSATAPRTPVMEARPMGEATSRASRGAEMSAAPGDESNERSVATPSGKFLVMYRTEPSGIPLNELFVMRVRVLDPASKQAVEGVKLDVDATMPAHGHGMNTKPKVTSQPDGGFKVEGMLFHMPGRWELYFDVTREGVTERAQVNVDLE